MMMMIIVMMMVNSTMSFIHHPSFKNKWVYMQTQVLYDVWNVSYEYN